MECIASIDIWVTSSEDFHVELRNQRMVELKSTIGRQYQPLRSCWKI